MAQTQENLQQRRFASSIWAQERENFARFDPKADPIQCNEFRAKRQRSTVRFRNIYKLGDEIGHGYFVSAICTPFCRICVNVLIIFVDICVSVPVIIWFDGKAVDALLCVPA
jgi:hypothetical protein